MTAINVGDRVRLPSGAQGPVFGVSVTAGAVSLQLVNAAAAWLPGDGAEILAYATPPDAPASADPAPASSETAPASSETAPAAPAP